jgi:hypothetical protein
MYILSAGFQRSCRTEACDPADLNSLPYPISDPNPSYSFGTRGNDIFDVFDNRDGRDVNDGRDVVLLTYYSR